MKKANTLIRLWIVISLLWAVVVVLYTWQYFPDISDAQRERITEMYEALVERERKINPEFEEKYGHVTASGLAQSIVKDGKADHYAANILKKWAGEIDFSAVEANFEKAKKQIPLMRLKHIGLAFTLWSILVILSFLLGWMILRTSNTNKVSSSSDPGEI